MCVCFHFVVFLSNHVKILIMAYFGESTTFGDLTTFEKSTTFDESKKFHIRIFPEIYPNPRKISVIECVMKIACFYSVEIFVEEKHRHRAPHPNRSNEIQAD